MVTLNSMLTSVSEGEREIETDSGRTSHGAWKKRRGREQGRKKGKDKISFSM